VASGGGYHHRVKSKRDLHSWVRRHKQNRSRNTIRISRRTRLLPLYFGLINATQTQRAAGLCHDRHSNRALNSERVRLACMENAWRHRGSTFCSSSTWIPMCLERARARERETGSYANARNSGHVEGCKLLERNNLGRRIYCTPGRQGIHLAVCAALHLSAFCFSWGRTGGRAWAELAPFISERLDESNYNYPTSTS